MRKWDLDKANGQVRRRLWVFSELYYPEETSTGYFLTKIAEGLAKDFLVRTVCGQPTYSERGQTMPNSEVHNGVAIHRMRATHFDKDRLALRAVNLATFTLATAIFGLRHLRRDDRILVVTNPPTVPLVIGLIAKLKGCLSTLLVHDVYPEVLAASGVLPRTSYFYRLLARIFAFTYGLFDRIVVLGRDMEQVVRDKLGGKAREIAIVPNWADVNDIIPIDRASNPFRREHELDDKFVVQFSGNIGRTHDIETILAAADLLRDDPRIVFLFVGYGGKSHLISDSGVTRTNVRFLPRQPRAALGAMLAASDITIISFVDEMFGLSVPSRMYNIMAAGVPILAVAHPDSELARTVIESHAGWHVRQGDPSKLAQVIEQLANHGKEELRLRGLAGQKRMTSHFRLESALDRYRVVLQ